MDEGDLGTLLVSLTLRESKGVSKIGVSIICLQDVAVTEKNGLTIFTDDISFLGKYYGHLLYYKLLHLVSAHQLTRSIDLIDQ